MIITILVFLVILTILVLIHEAGHFFVAKWLGIKVEEFGFGFPPKAFSIKRGETEYSINWLPIGGFVKLYGEDEAGGGKISISNKKQLPSHKDLDRAFFARPVWQKALVIVAGVFMNFLLAVVIYSYLAAFQGLVVPGGNIVVSQVAKNSPAEKAGITVSDTIVAFDNIHITSADQLILLTHQDSGKTVSIQLRDTSGKEKTLTVIPRKNYPKNQGSMGVAITSSTKLVTYSFPQAFVVGFNQSVLTVKLTIFGLGVIISQLFQGKGIPAGVAGPIGIARLTGEVVKQYGLYALFSLAGLISVNLALFNILPIPALDGGRLFFILVNSFLQKLFGKQIDSKTEAYIHMVAFFILISLVALISIRDVQQWIAGVPLLPQ